MNKPTFNCIGRKVRLSRISGTVSAWYGAEGTIVQMGSLWGSNDAMCVINVTKGPSLGRNNVSWWQLEWADIPKENILGWFPKKPEADDTIADVDWNPFT